MYDTVTEGPEYEVIKGGGRKAKEEFALKECPAYDTVTEGPEYEVIKGGGKKAKEECALKECPAYIPVTAPGGGAGGVANSDGMYEVLP